MAIPFAYLTPTHLTEHGGAASTIAYIARNSVHDPRFPQSFDYSHLRSDLAFEDIILPVDCPVTLLRREKLAIALDEVELRKIRTPLSERIRLPQVGLALVVALPPSTEVSLDEAAEIFRRIVLAARGSVPAPIHLAIHEARINRHGHALFALRPVDSDGVLGLKVRDFIVRLRHTLSANEDADVVEGVHWPNLTWEVHQTYFHELGIDLVVDPIAPKPGKHLSPVVYSSGRINNKTNEQIASSCEQAYEANVRAIEGSPTHLVETLLRGRSSLRIAELERLCAKFYDSETDQIANVERILLDQNVIALTDAADDKKPSYATTRRIHRLLTRATRLIGGTGEVPLQTFTGIYEASLVAQISDACAAAEHPEYLLVLGAKLSHCSAVAKTLAKYAPVPGTIDMVIGSSKRRLVGRARDVRLRRGRLIVVPRADLIDDQSLARLMVAVNHVGSTLVLGHDQSSQTGVVCRHLAAYAADCAASGSSPNCEDRDSNEIVRLLRAGLMRHGIDEMAKRGLLEFGSLPDSAHNSSLFVACDDPRSVGDLCRTIRRERAMAGSIGKPVLLTARGQEAEFSVGEWIVVAEPAENVSSLKKAVFAWIVAVDAANTNIDVDLAGETKRIDLKHGHAIRPASVLTIREARSLFAAANLAVRATDRRRLWSALLLVAMRGQNARLHIDPALAQNRAELIDIARQSLPGALPHQRAAREDPDAELGKIISDITSTFEVLPDITPVEIRPPRPIHATEGVRRLLAQDRDAREGYRLLYKFVGPHNPDHVANTSCALDRYPNELTKTVIRFLAGTQRNDPPDPGPHFDHPPELDDLEPERWTYSQVYGLRTDLRCLTIPGWDCPINPASNFVLRRPGQPRARLAASNR